MVKMKRLARLARAGSQPAIMLDRSPTQPIGAPQVSLVAYIHVNMPKLLGGNWVLGFGGLAEIVHAGRVAELLFGQCEVVWSCCVSDAPIAHLATTAGRGEVCGEDPICQWLLSSRLCEVHNICTL